MESKGVIYRIVTLNLMVEKMKTQLLYYFGDARIQYSREHLESLLSDGIIDPTTIVHTVCLPFKASDLIEHVAPLLDKHMVSTIDEPTQPL